MEYQYTIGNAVAAFEYAHKILDENLKIFVKEYDESLDKEDDLHTLRLATYVPTVVMLAITIEMALKAILYQRTGSFPHIHFLDKLFDQIENHRKTRIIKYVQNRKGISEKEFYEMLEGNTNTFVDWRYFFSAREDLHADNDFLGYLKEATFKEVYIDSTDLNSNQY